VVALRLRIEHARELLRTTDLPQRDIAQYCGFADVHHFSKAFKRLTRLPPGAHRTAYSAYRQSCHSNELRCRRTLVFSAPLRLRSHATNRSCRHPGASIWNLSLTTLPIGTILIPNGSYEGDGVNEDDRVIGRTRDCLLSPHHRERSEQSPRPTGAITLVAPHHVLDRRPRHPRPSLPLADCRPGRGTAECQVPSTSRLGRLAPVVRIGSAANRVSPRHHPRCRVDTHPLSGGHHPWCRPDTPGRKHT
jgi:hypothetical protein